MSWFGHVFSFLLYRLLGVQLLYGKLCFNIFWSHLAVFPIYIQEWVRYLVSLYTASLMLVIVFFLL